MLVDGDLVTRAGPRVIEGLRAARRGAGHGDDAARRAPVPPHDGGAGRRAGDHGADRGGGRSGLDRAGHDAPACSPGSSASPSPGRRRSRVEVILLQLRLPRVPLAVWWGPPSGSPGCCSRGCSGTRWRGPGGDRRVVGRGARGDRRDRGSAERRSRGAGRHERRVRGGDRHDAARLRDRAGRLRRCRSRRCCWRGSPVAATISAVMSLVCRSRASRSGASTSGCSAGSSARGWDSVSVVVPFIVVGAGRHVAAVVGHEPVSLGEERAAQLGVEVRASSGARSPPARCWRRRRCPWPV